MLSRADVNDNVKSILGFTFKNSFLFHVHLTLETITESQFYVLVGCDGFRKSVSGRIDSSASVPRVLRFSFSLCVCVSLSPSLALSPSLLSSLSCNNTFVGRRTQKESFYVHEISQEFAYVQITSRWFKISHRQICLRQPYLFLPSALQARHVSARFECPGTLRPLPSHSSV